MDQDPTRSEEEKKPKQDECPHCEKPLDKCECHEVVRSMT